MATRVKKIFRSGAEVVILKQRNGHSDIVGDATCVGPRWKRWRRSFEFYVVAKGITTDVQKKALLLHTSVMAVQDLFETLTDPGPFGDGEDAAGE